MRVAILHDTVSAKAAPDEMDGLIQVGAVSEALAQLGYEPVDVTFTLDTRKVMDVLRTVHPDLVFNLVESVEGQGRLIHNAPAVLDAMGMRYTGCPADAFLLSSNKLTAKRLLLAAGIPTPPWVSHHDPGDGVVSGKTSFIIKSVWEHASIGIDGKAIVCPRTLCQLGREIRSREGQLGRDCFAEVYIDGREFNLSLLASGGGPEVLPPAEIEFTSYPPGKWRIVDYDAKWNPRSFAYLHTPRSFHFSSQDGELLKRLVFLARSCWDLFGLRGYARVDFRVDSSGCPWVLEVNANPCISPDSGFVAAAHKAGLSFRQLVERIVQDALAQQPRERAGPMARSRCIAGETRKRGRAANSG